MDVRPDAAFATRSVLWRLSPVVLRWAGLWSPEWGGKEIGVSV